MKSEERTRFRDDQTDATDGKMKHRYLHRSEVPEELRLDHVNWGYRPTPSSLVDCVRSAFQATNETFNFWTHFVPFVLMVCRTVSVATSSDNPFQSINFPFYVHSFTICYVFLVSSVAHLFSSYSVYGVRCLFLVDEVAIAFYGFAAAVAFENLLCPSKCYTFVTGVHGFSWVLGMLVVQIVLTTLLCLVTKGFLKNKTLYRDVAFVVAISLSHVPCFIRHFRGEASLNESCRIGERLGSIFWLQLAFLALAWIPFVFSVPEKWFPGCFDIIGQSHQIFHILSALALYTQNLIVEQGMMERRNHLKLGIVNEEQLGLTWVTTVGVYIFNFAMCNTILYVYLKYFDLKPDKKTS